MGLFDKKYCDICGNKIGLLGNRKLEDGNCCKDCAKKLSPWFDERRHSTVAQIKEQLTYRENNKQAVAAFNPTRSFGDSYRLLYIDEPAQRFLIAGGGSWRDDNPDVLDIVQVTDVNLDIRDSRRELKQKDDQGKEISYNPPRFEYAYDFDIKIRVNHPWFDEMQFRLNRNKLVIQELGAVKRGFFTTQTSFDPHMSYEYQNYENMGREIADILLRRTNASAVQDPSPGSVDREMQTAASAGQPDPEKLFAAIRQDPSMAEQARKFLGDDAVNRILSAAAPAPAPGTWVCACGASNTGKFCEYCGNPRP